MKSSSTLFTQIKTRVRCHLTPFRAITRKQQITNVGEDVEKREPSFTVGVNVHLFSHNGKQLKMKNRTLYHPTISLLGIYPKEMKIGYWRVLCIPIFIIALFTKTKIWKPQNCLSKCELMKKM
jgi:hypothetical protein